MPSTKSNTRLTAAVALVLMAGLSGCGVLKGTLPSGRAKVWVAGRSGCPAPVGAARGVSWWQLGQ